MGKVIKVQTDAKLDLNLPFIKWKEAARNEGRHGGIASPARSSPPLDRQEEGTEVADLKTMFDSNHA